MIQTVQFGNALKKLGFDFYSGVPCSFLKDLINYALNECDFVMGANEGQSAAVAAGAYLGGKKSVFLCQNSGLTNASSPLTSLNSVFQIPVLGFVSLRGEEGIGDEPQHELMGKITGEMLSAMKIKWEILSADHETALKQITNANQWIEKKESYFFVVKMNSFESVPLLEKEYHPTRERKISFKVHPETLPSRIDVLESIVKNKTQKTVLIASTGFTGRELYETGDNESNLYIVGSMGLASSIGLGLALARPDWKVIVIDGDAAFLMHMGSLTGNAYYRPKNLLHIVLDNHIHESTGGQFTFSSNADFVRIASASGYPASLYLHDNEEMIEEIRQWEKEPKLTFLYLRIRPGVKDNLGRPKIKPFEVKERLMKFLGKKIE
ncbi:MAG TPA: phosphonopyruvate decarboxylase [Spirochaetia bacterium]|nr:phosphonopyruvate decarboxylase [Spirochaetia bacterium]